MKYVSIDLETTGLDPINNQIIEVAAVIDDTQNPRPLDQLPSFQAFVHHKSYTGSAYAINLNARIFKVLSDVDADKQKNNCLSLESAMNQLYDFLNNNLDQPFNVAGKNFAGFDKPFFMFADFPVESFHYKILDPGSMYTTKDDIEVPSLNECMKRAGYVDHETTHEALDDALDVIKLIRYKMETRKTNED